MDQRSVGKALALQGATMIIYRNRSKQNTRPEYSAAGEQIDRVEVELFAESSPKDETSQKAKPRQRIYLASQACRIRGLV